MDIRSSFSSPSISPFGNNSRNLYQCGDLLPIVETFHSIQGEGFWAGTNAFFIRLAGCDVGCQWCDQKESWSVKNHPAVNIAGLVVEAKSVNPAIVVITGGEPLLHNLALLASGLKQVGLKVHLETSGVHPLSGSIDWITLSPKRHKPPQSYFYKLAHELKVVIRGEEDLKWAEECSDRVAPECYRLLQPEWNTLEGAQIVFDYVLRNPQWRMSLQTHKYLGVL